ncbi:hypothetical protein CYMTET_14426 [Cymbomonas tetramitiformis]|uniref:Uncharacterized protein n=1 Tax=Cymbomonas tetramitiformis TaxID=36881 RepID=A0AAE0GG44_9CHLO|nr:hypothetical protein CYMTET_14426 [Cymbomonas tetramitiformis]
MADEAEAAAVAAEGGEPPAPELAQEPEGFDAESPMPKSVDQLMAMSHPTGPGTHKSVHLNVMKSMSMLHDLQDYIAGVEKVAAARKAELQKLHNEKKEYERRMRTAARKDARHVDNDFSNFSNKLDEATKVRSLNEDIKFLKDKVKKYKEKCVAGERTITAQQHQIISTQERLKVVSEALRATGKNPKQVFDEQAILEELKRKDDKIADLEHRLSVITRSKEVEIRKFQVHNGLHKNDLDILKAEIESLRRSCEEKDKMIRMDAMKIKSLAKQLEPMRRQLSKPKEVLKRSPEQQSFLATESSLFLTQPSEQAVPEPVKPAPAPAPTDEREVVVMLCMIGQLEQIMMAEKLEPAASAEEEPKVTVTELPEGAEEAAVKIQAHMRGCLTRKEMSAKGEGDEGATGEEEPKEETSGTAEDAELAAETPAEAPAEPAPEGESDPAQEEAAVKIQTQMRGHLARKEVNAMKASKEAGEVETKEDETTTVSSKPLPAGGGGAKTAIKPGSRVQQPTKPRSMPNPNAKKVLEAKGQAGKKGK